MRSCLRCRADMREGLECRIKGSGMKITAAKTGGLLGSRPLANLKLAVCPACGYAELYVEDAELPLP